MLTFELSEKIRQYIDSSITVEQLEEWLVPRLPSYLKSPDSIEADVVAGVELGLAEMADGIRTEDEFRSLLSRVLQEQATVLAFFPTPVREYTESGSANTTSQVVHSTNNAPVTITVL